MNISVFEAISVSESFIKIYPPALYQANLGIVSGNRYRLTFESVITSGVLEVYQGDQLIYISGGVYLSELITLSENTSLNIFFPINLSDSVTITESTTITVV